MRSLFRQSQRCVKIARQQLARQCISPGKAPAGLDHPDNNSIPDSNSLHHRRGNGLVERVLMAVYPWGLLYGPGLVSGRPIKAAVLGWCKEYTRGNPGGPSRLDKGNIVPQGQGFLEPGTSEGLIWRKSVECSNSAAASF